MFTYGLTLEDGTDKSHRNAGKKTTNQRCLTSQKNEDLIYTAEENFDHERYL